MDKQSGKKSDSASMYTRIILESFNEIYYIPFIEK
jgi:hypothetical protein